MEREWHKIPEELLDNEFNALVWLNKFDVCLYRGLNSQPYSIVQIDHDLTIQFAGQPRRFHVRELEFCKL